MKLTTLLLSFILSCNLMVFSGSLNYDRATGNLDGFLVTTTDSPNYPSGYENATEVWDKSGFIGRLLYLGEPTTFTFTNIGRDPSGTSNNRFYFILNNTGTADTAVWKEFFIVARAKGITQGGSQYTFTSVNSVIANNGESFSLAYGAGTELVTVGQTGYDTNRQSGIYNGSNAYRYKYPYQIIWIDLTLIRTSASSSITRGYYESHIRISTDTGLCHELHLSGEYKPRTNHLEPDPYFFGIEQLYTQAFPFSELENRNTPASALEVATIRYTSHIDQAQIRIASNVAGNDTNFRFTSDEGLSFPFKVVYDGTIPNLAAVEVTPSSNTFTTVSNTVTSPVGGSYTANRLEGTIKLFVPANTQPSSGLYSSTIYILVTQVD